jgi:methionyl-tRNA formyltransferase
MWRDYDEVPHGDIAFFLSCMRITPPDVLKRHHWNFVVHASDLPKGRGFSPLVWQVLEGANDIPVTMIEMSDEVDAGDIVCQDKLRLSGHELNPEMRERLAELIVSMCIDVVMAPTPPERRPQVGTPTWYPRRRAEDSQLDPSLSLADQFNHLRVVDNARYPAFFDFRGRRFRLLIEDAGPAPGAELDEE